MSQFIVLYGAALLGGYLLGSVPFGYLLTRLAGLGDIRAIGSGSIGATNVLRTGKRPLAILTVLLDGGKGAAALLIAGAVDPHLAPWAGGAAIIGHLFPVWLHFRGGKGVATAYGVLTALAWPVGLIAMGLWLIVALIGRYSSLSALVSLGLTPLIACAMGYPDVTAVATVIGFLVYIRHSSNIRRLADGTEPKIGKSKPSSSP